LPNPWGLYDLAGLGLQWCEDLDHDNYIGAPSDGAPWLEPRVERRSRMLRGGADYNQEGLSAERFTLPETMRSDWSCFRLKASGPGPRDVVPSIGLFAVSGDLVKYERRKDE
jgi:formylglycine-generating enzyme required for sulfatase activity